MDPASTTRRNDSARIALAVSIVLFALVQALGFWILNTIASELRMARVNVAGLTTRTAVLEAHQAVLEAHHRSERFFHPGSPRPLP